MASNIQASEGLDASPSDSDDLTKPSYGLFIGTGGDVKVMLLDSTVAVTFKNIPDGSFMPIIVKRLYNTGTTASDIITLH